MIREYRDEDFPFIQKLYAKNGWKTPIKRERETLIAFKNSQILLVALEDGSIIGFLRGLTDTEIITYVAEIVVEENHRGKGVGTSLLHYCHKLYPQTKIDVISSPKSVQFYKKLGFRKSSGFRKNFIR